MRKWNLPVLTISMVLPLELKWRFNQQMLWIISQHNSCKCSYHSLHTSKSSWSFGFYWMNLLKVHQMHQLTSPHHIQVSGGNGSNQLSTLFKKNSIFLADLDMKECRELIKEVYESIQHWWGVTFLLPCSLRLVSTKWSLYVVTISTWRHI